MDDWVFTAGVLLLGMVFGAQMALTMDPDTSLGKLEALAVGLIVPIWFPFVVTYRVWKFGRWRRWLRRGPPTLRP